VTLRPFVAGDEEQIVALWEACGLLRPWNDPYEDIARKRRVQPELFLVALENGDVVGTAMAGYDGHRGWLYYLAVSPAWQGRGVGRALVQAVEEGLRAMGCPKLNLQVRAENEAVAAFYARLGYQLDRVSSLGKRL
jgi:ribosomal protein S18 acetylase RimI-like enzyme